MKTILSFFSIIVLITVFTFYLSSCSPVPYSNVGQNVPLFKNKGEVSLTGNYASTDDATGIGIQGAAAVDSSLAFMTSFYSLKNSTNANWQGSGKYFEFGSGKFGVVGRSNFVYDVFGGLGFGGIKNHAVGSSLNVSFIKPFVQSSIGLTTKWVDVAFTARLALPTYTNYKNGLSDATQHAQAETYFGENKSQFVFEPGLTLRLGYKAVKANFTVCTSTFRLADEYEHVSANNNYVSVGLAVLVSKRYKQYNATTGKKRP